MCDVFVATQHLVPTLIHRSGTLFVVVLPVVMCALR